MSAETGMHAYYSPHGEIVVMHSGTLESARNQDNSYAGAVGYIAVDPSVTPFSHYIRDGKAVEKSVLSPTVTTDGMEATISGLPSGLTVLWDGEKGVTDDDPLELDHDEPGTYTLRIMGGAPYYDTSIEVTLG